jgi:putative membrane protein
MNESEPDYRFTLANERTFLSYTRTAIALDGSGLAVVQFLTKVGTHEGRLLVGIVLVVGGLATALAGYYRWRSVQKAMRRDQPLPSSYAPAILTLILAIGSLGAAIVLALR